MKRFNAWMFVVIWMFIIFYLSHQPAQTSSELSSSLTIFIINTLQNIVPNFPTDLSLFHLFIRKVAHFIAYLILGFLTTYALTYYVNKLLKKVGLSFLICTLYAILDEVHQLFIPGRSGEIKDVLIDCIGAIVGISLYLFLLRQFNSKS